MTTVLSTESHNDTTLELSRPGLAVSPAASSWNSPVDVSYGSHVALGVFMLPVTALSLGGNGLVIWIFVRFKSLRTPANLLVINLALSDFLMCLAGYPLFVASSFNGEWMFNKHVCEFYGTTGAWFALMSINSMAAIAVDRYLIINRGYKITYKQSYCCLLLIWLYALLWALPPLLGWSRYSTEAYGTTCSFDYLVKNTRDRYFLMCVVIGDFLFPLTIICYCYTWIILKYRSHQQQFGSLLSCSRTNSDAVLKNSFRRCSEKRTGDSERSELMQNKKAKMSNKFRSTEFRIARTVVFVVVVFCVSWTPYAVVSLIGQYGPRDIISPTAAMVPVILAKLSTVYNPFIYALTHPRFKVAIRKVFPFCPKRKIPSRHYAFKSRGRYRDGLQNETSKCTTAVQLPQQNHHRAYVTETRENSTNSYECNFMCSSNKSSPNKVVLKTSTGRYKSVMYQSASGKNSPQAERTQSCKLDIPPLLCNTAPKDPDRKVILFVKSGKDPRCSDSYLSDHSSNRLTISSEDKSTHERTKKMSGRMLGQNTKETLVGLNGDSIVLDVFSFQNND